jgi:hypothetical protein
MRQRHLIFASDSGVLTMLHGFGGIPQRFALTRPRGGCRIVFCRKNELCVFDAALAGVVEHFAGALICDARS